MFKRTVGCLIACTCVNTLSLFLVYDIVYITVGVYNPVKVCDFVDNSLAFTHFSKKRWVSFDYRGQKLGSRVNFLDVLKYPEYENRIFRVSYTYIIYGFCD